MAQKGNQTKIRRIIGFVIIPTLKSRPLFVILTLYFREEAALRAFTGLENCSYTGIFFVCKNSPHSG